MHLSTCSSPTGETKKTTTGRKQKRQTIKEISYHLENHRQSRCCRNDCQKISFMKEYKLLVGWISSQNTSRLFKAAVACSHPDLCVLHFLKQICTAIFFRRVKPEQMSLCDTQNFRTASELPWLFFHTL